MDLQFEKIAKLFPSEGFPEIRYILAEGHWLAVKEKHINFTIAHIVYGYLKYIKDIKYDVFPWQTPPEQYLWDSYILTNQKKTKKDELNLTDDVKFFAKQYKSYLSFMNLETFYLLLLHLDSNHFFNSNYAFPADSSILTHDLSHSFFSDYLNKRGTRLYLDQIEKSSKKTANRQISNDVKFSIFNKALNIERTTDITNLAYNKKTFEIVGRDYEINRLVDILSKMIKNNVVLIGEPGVGKTAIVHALAQRIVTGKVPKALAEYHILEFDLSSAVAGSKYRGDFEERIKILFNELQQSNDKIILYIDEIHSIVNAGNAEGALSFSDILKPIAFNSNIKIIGTSTFKDYRHLEADAALSRRFDTITVKQPNFEETIKILNHVKLKFEKNYDIEIPYSTLESVILLSQRYIPERFLPEKAIDVLDEACAIKKNTTSDSKTKLLTQDILTCISRKKDIPINKIQKKYNLADIEEHLNSKIIGQNHVNAIVAKAIRRTQAGLNDENRPLASFLFIGPTGVGKTEESKELANIMFSTKDSFIRFDMSEYVEEHSIAKLIGSPPGYVGYDDAGLLTEAVRRHPYSLVLFDEIEKAHPKIWNLFLQILDEGCLTDSHGDHINFKNTIVIMTSNVGSGQLSKKTTGFGEHSNSKQKDILSEIKKSFPPEFLNRLDEIIQFNQLTEQDITKIAKIMISTDIEHKLKKKNITLDISDEVIKKIASHGYSQEYGARELKRTISRELKDPLTDFILENNDIKSITVKLVNDTIVFSSNAKILV